MSDEPPSDSRRIIALWAIGIGAAAIGIALWVVILL